MHGSHLNRRLRMVAAGLVLLPLAAAAESSPEAAEWLKKVAAIYERTPLTADLAMEMAAAPTMPLSGTASGRLVVGDATHMRMEMVFEMSGAEGQGGMKLNILSVNDGTTMWNEVDMGMGKQVTKLARADADAMAQQSPFGVNMGAGGMDPVSQVEQLGKLFDFEVVDAAGGEVTLRGELSEESRQTMGSQAAAAGFEAVTLVLDAKNGFPVRVMIGGAEPVITVRFANLKFVPKSELPAGAFQYTPPEGAPVIDAAAMMKRQGGGG